MESDDFEDLLVEARRAAKLFTTLFRNITGEEFSVESSVRHYPLVALGLAAGVGAVSGWWLGRSRARQRPQLKPKRRMDLIAETVRELLPERLPAPREVARDLAAGDRAAMAKTWLDTVLEPKFRQGLESVISNIPDGTVRVYLKERVWPVRRGEHGE